jgi:hypothetical protein
MAATETWLVRCSNTIGRKLVWRSIRGESPGPGNVHKLAHLFIATMLAVQATPAAAQMAWSDAYKSPMSSWGAYMYDQNVKRHLREGTTGSTSASASASGSSAKAAAPATPRAPLSATDFRRSATGKDVVAQFIADAKLSPSDGTAVAARLRATMAELGAAGRKDNVATAMTLLIGLSWSVLEKPGFDPKRADDLVPVVNDALAASAQFASLGAQDRQTMYDSLLLTTATLALLMQSGDKATSRAIATEALQQLGNL